MEYERSYSTSKGWGGGVGGWGGGGGGDIVTSAWHNPVKLFIYSDRVYFNIWFL